MEYFGYLQRDPDPDGFAFWLGKLNSLATGRVPRWCGHLLFRLSIAPASANHNPICAISVCLSGGRDGRPPVMMAWPVLRPAASRLDPCSPPSQSLL